MISHDIVASARGWIGTRFHHQGRLKKTPQHRGGVDCLGLLIGIARELSLTLPDGWQLADLDRCDYPHYPDTVALKGQLDMALRPIEIEEIAPGDIALIVVDAHPQHLAIISDAPGGLGIIHAYAPAHAVVEHALDDWWRARIISLYRTHNT